MNRTYIVPILFMAIFLGQAFMPPCMTMAKNEQLPSTEEKAAFLDALINIKSYRFGESREMLTRVSDYLKRIHGRPQARKEAVLSLAQLLQEEITAECRDFICRELSVVGDGECVPYLTSLLRRPEEADMARYALERIQSVEAQKVLLEALAWATDEPLIGIINSLGVRRDPSAVDALAIHLVSPDLQIATASAAALGKIGGQKALRFLMEAQDKGSIERHMAIADAALLCADQLLKEGKSREAAKVYDHYYKETEPQNIRIAAFNGLVSSSPEETVPLVVNLLVHGDTQTQGLATRYVREMSGQETTKAFASQLQQMSPEGQILLLDALSIRGDPEAIPMVRESYQSDSEALRIAALRTLTHLSDHHEVSLLSQAAAQSHGLERETAREGLARLRGPYVNRTMARQIRKSPPAVQIELIKALGVRRAFETTPSILKTLKKKNVAVRMAAFDAMGLLGKNKDLTSLLKALKRVDSSQERKAAEDSISSVATRIKDATLRSAAILKSFGRADDPTRGSLLRIMGKIGGKECLEIVRVSLENDNIEIQDAAIRALSEWPDISCGQDLLNIASESSNQVHSVLALRGYVRVVGLPSYRSAEETLDLLDAAMDVAERVEEKRMVLAGIGNVTHRKALDRATRYLAYPELNTEAAAAMIKIARSIADTNPEDALQSLLEVRSVAESDSLRTQAGTALDEIQWFDDYIQHWLLDGPYGTNNMDSASLIKMVFPPEDPLGFMHGKPARVTEGTPGWRVDLDKLLGGDNQVAYLVTWVWSPSEQASQLQLGSDDGIVAWVNDVEVHRNPEERGLTPAQDRVQVHLNQGWNRLMLKISQAGGDWAACARFRDPLGGPLSLEIQHMGEENALQQVRQDFAHGTPTTERELLRILSAWPTPLQAAELLLQAFQKVQDKENASHLLLQLANTLRSEDIEQTQRLIEFLLEHGQGQAREAAESLFSVTPCVD